MDGEAEQALRERPGGVRPRDPRSVAEHRKGCRRDGVGRGSEEAVRDPPARYRTH